MTKYTKILLCIISIVCLFSFVSCSSTKTLEDYANKDKEFKSDVNNMFSNAGVEGKVDISKNTIYMTIDISSLIGDMKVTDDFADESGMTDMKVQAMLDIKRSYSGMEVMGVINKFNRINGWKKNTITVIYPKKKQKKKVCLL